jgi:hypothetical protein
VVRLDCRTYLVLIMIAWAMAWFLWEAGVFTSAIFAGICVFKVSPPRTIAKR